MTATEQHEGRTTGFRTDLREASRKLWKRTSVMHKRLVLLLIVVGAALRIVMIGEPITYDEAHAFIRFVLRPFSEIPGDLSHPSNHVFHSLLAKLSISIFGIGIWQVRLPALVAGIAVLPLFYLFTRATFNRYIAVMALALAAGSGPLIEYSALARGYSLGWMFFMAALLLGRHLGKTNSVTSAALLGLTNAFALWTVPTMLFGVATVYVWVLLFVMSRYETTINRRLGRVALSVVLFLLFSFVLYAPALFTHGIAQLFYHPSMGDNSWEAFSEGQHAAATDLWLWISSTAAIWVSFLGVVALLYAVYISSKYRALLFALGLGCVPLVIVQRMVGPPQVWAFSLFIFHMGTAIALFYLLKLIEDRLVPTFSKRLRTALASMLLLALFGTASIFALIRPDRIERFGDARLAARTLTPLLGAHDRVFAEFPWEAPMEFYLLSYGADRAAMRREPDASGTMFLVVSPADGQDPQSVLLHNKRPGHHASTAHKINDWKRLEIYAARMVD